MKFLLIALFVSCASAFRLKAPTPKLWSSEDSYIVGGDEAAVGQFPFQAVLLSSTSPGGSLTCGGVYIGANSGGNHWLLNAAHCTQSSARSTWLGLHRRSDTSDGQHFTFVRIVNHPNYGSGAGAFPNDISLCEINGAVDTSGSNVGAADLAEGDNDYAGVSAIISGWGRTCGGCALPDELRFVETTVLPNSGANSCQTDWGSNVNDGHICVKSGDQSSGACNGDSGGPMSIGNMVIGVTSWGASGCLTSYPSAYSRVSFFRDWIREVSDI
uniref:Protease n=1 Tax=Arenicola cristata TaxID=273048 RepID=A0A0A7KY80_ARECR|nr:protease [Arenicola cristata]